MFDASTKINNVSRRQFVPAVLSRYRDALGSQYVTRAAVALCGDAELAT
jgi:hypothetical protein